MIHFPISGVDAYWWLPALVALSISSVTSTGGVSGAVLILPFQVSILGFGGPAVSPTNLLYNIVAIPSGVYRYYKERRMVWPLTWTIIIGTLPGLFLGAIIRIKFLPDARAFKLFAGIVLFYIGVRLAMDLFDKTKKLPAKAVDSGQFHVTPLEFNLRRIGYKFNGVPYYASTFWLFILSLIVGVVGGTYGIGGGAIIAPFLVTIFRLPVHTVAGAALMGTFLSSIAGVIIYALISPFYSNTHLPITPDWLLGTLFGIGGAMGMYIGARLQRYMPAKLIKGILSACVLFIAIKYIIDFFLK
jgi:uncharacterized membrane protein YfcA